VSQKTFQNQRLKTQGVSWQSETPDRPAELYRNLPLNCGIYRLVSDHLPSSGNIINCFTAEIEHFIQKNNLLQNKAYITLPSRLLFKMQRGE
jgi:hypothetical protein